MRKGLTLATTLASLFLMGTTAVSAAGWTPPEATATGGNDSPRKAVATTLPYFNDFNEEAKFEGWTVKNPQPIYTWQWYPSGGQEYTGCLYMSQMPYNGMEGGPAADNWAFSPAFDLQKGFTYRLKFYITNWFDADVDVFILTSADINDKGQLLYHYEGQEWGNKESEFEVPESGKYYLAFHDKSPYTYNGTALRCQVYVDNLQLEELSNNAVPEAVGDLRQVPGKNGELSMSLTWTNPKLSKMGETLEALSSVQIYRDGKLVETLRDNIVPGGKMAWTDTTPTEGEHTYQVIISNTTGDSDPAEVNTFVGIDDCGAPQNLNLDYDADAGKVILDWEAPEFGRRGGWYDNTGLTYRVVRRPDGKLLANNSKRLYYEDSDLANYGNYIYEVTARTDAGLGGTTISKGVLVGQTATLPIIEGFENPDTYPTWEIVDNNEDGHTLFVGGNGYDSNKSIGWNYVSTDVEVDESLYFAPVKFEKGKKYRASFCMNGHTYGSYCIDLTYGKAKTKAAQTGKILTYTDVTTGGEYAQSEGGEFTVPETGTYYIGFRLYNIVQKPVWFDNFRIEEIFDKNIEATSVRNLNNYPTAGDKVTTGVSYTNRGTSSASSFKVQLIDDEQNVLGEQTVSRALAAGAEGTANIEWTVPECVGRFAIRGRVVLDGDKCEADNVTEPIYLTVQQHGMRAVLIGTSDQLSRVLPFGYYSYNFSESIYPKEEFGGVVGNITGMKYKVQFGQDADFPKVPFAIYIANTNEDDLFKGWIGYGFTKVFDGTIDIMRGMTEVDIPFDTPFAYNGNNIAVRVVGAHDPTLMLSQGYNIQNYVTEAGIGVSRVWDDRVNRPDPANIDQNVGAFHSIRPNATFMLDHSVSISLHGKITDKDGNPVEGAKVSGGNTYPNIYAMTDAEGNYKIQYYPLGYGTAQIMIEKLGYTTAYAYGSNYKAGMDVEVNYAQLTPVAKVKVIGTVCSGIDNATPVKDAVVKISGNGIDATMITDADGKFEIADLYAQTKYTQTIEAPGFKPYSNTYAQFWANADGENLQTTNLTPITAAPASITAHDRGTKAEISWEAPQESVTVAKCSDDIVGQFGGSNGTITIAHRYTPEELKNLGVGEDLLLKSIKFFPMCYSKYTLAIWQGPEGNEAPVYLQDTEVTQYQLKNWIEKALDKPYKIDPTKSLLVGLKIQLSSGAYPVGFDFGPLQEGGDVLFDPVMNEWTTAHDVLPDNMKYNWALQAIFGPNPNKTAVPWTVAAQNAPAQKAVSIHGATLEELAMLNDSMTDNAEVKSANPADCSIEMLDAPIHAPVERAALSHPYIGYNLYRLEAGQENMWIGSLTKLNDEPITDTKYTDETWGALDNKTYRYAVTTYYGAPTQWSTVYSDLTFSDGVDKGHYSTVTVNVNPDNGNADNTKVYLVGDGKTFEKSVKAGETSVSFEDVRFTDYKVMAMKPYFDLYTADLKVSQATVSHNAAIKFSAPAPTALRATDYIKEARLAWTAPTSEVGCTFAQCSDNPSEAMNYKSGQEIIVGSRLTPAMREAYNYTDFYIDEISFYVNAATTYKPVVWRRNLEPQRPYYEAQEMEEEHEIYRQEYKATEDEVGTWVTVKLDQPVKLDNASTYYYGFAAMTTSEHLPLILDDSKGVYGEGMWYYDWDQKNAKYAWILPSMGGSWMVKAHITDTPDKSTIVTEPVKFDIYRLAEADIENESAWTKVNLSAIEAESFADKTWINLADADYRYAVKANFNGGATSKAALSKMLPKGKVSLVNATIKTNNGLSAAGAKFALKYANNNYRAEADANGNIEIPEVVKGKNYHLNITLPGYEEIAEKLNVDKAEVSASYELAEVKEAPVYLHAEAPADNSKVELSWREPGAYAPAEGWAYWDNGKPYAGFGTSTGFCAVAQAYTPEDLEAKRMKEYDITKISFFPTSSTNNPVSESAYWVAKIWLIDENTGMTEEVATGNGKNVKLDQWNEIELDTPYHINGDETLLIGYEFHGTGNALGIDEGPLKSGRGDWANFGQGWSTLSSSVSGFNYNVLVHAYMENLDKSDRQAAPAVSYGEKQPILKDAKAEISMQKVSTRNAVAADHPMLVTGVKYHNTGYLVYRLNSKDRENESAWTQLTPNPISATEFADVNWKNVSKGDYRWAVKAVYATGNSDAVLTEGALNEDGSVNGVEGISEDGISVIANDGQIIVTVPEDASVIVSDVKGINLLSAELTAGTTVLEVNGADGVCLVTLDMNGRVSNYKVMIRK